MSINLNILRYIAAIADTGSFSAAAKALYISQPYLSQCIKAFEAETGVVLFDRASHPIKVTSAGMCFVQWSKNIEQSEKSVISRAQMISGGSQQTLTIISSRFRNIVFLPPYVAEISARVPECKIVLRTAPSIEDRASELMQKNADVLIDMVPYQMSSDLASRQIGEEHIVLAVPISHPLCPDAGNPVIRLSDFSGHKFISQVSGQKYHSILIDICSRFSFYPNITIETPDIPTTCAMVAQGGGVAIVPDALQNIGMFGDKVRFCRIQGVEDVLPYYITYYKRLEHMNAFSALLQLIERDRD